MFIAYMAAGNERGLLRLFGAGIAFMLYSVYQAVRIIRSIRQADQSASSGKNNKLEWGILLATSVAGLGCITCALLASER